MPDTDRWLLPFRMMWDARAMAERYGRRTPSDVVYVENKMRVLRYRPKVDRTYPIPLVMTSPVIMPYYIMDLKPGKSLVEYLVGRGLDVFMIDWGAPEVSDRFDTFDDYIIHYLDHAIDAIRHLTGQRHVTLHGYCQGGLLAVLYTVLFPDKVHNLISQTGPIDFHDDGIFSLWARKLNVDLLVDALGLIPAEVLWVTFQAVNPIGALGQILRFFEQMEDAQFVDDFVAMNTWLNHMVPLPGEFFRKFITDFYQGNLLVKGELAIAGRRIDLHTIVCPVLTITARKDHIVPWQSAAVLNDMIGSMDKQLLLMTGGHLGMTVGRGAWDELWPTFAEWVIQRSHDGSMAQAEKTQ